MIKTISNKLKTINIKIKYMVNNSNIAHMLFKISHCTLLLGQDLLHNSLYIIAQFQQEYHRTLDPTEVGTGCIGRAGKCTAIQRQA